MKSKDQSNNNLGFSLRATGSGKMGAANRVIVVLNRGEQLALDGQVRIDG